MCPNNGCKNTDIMCVKDADICEDMINCTGLTCQKYNIIDMNT